MIFYLYFINHVLLVSCLRKVKSVMLQCDAFNPMLAYRIRTQTVRDQTLT
jgi:hypothetical protein